MSFLEMRFPELISFNSSSIVQFDTSVVVTKNGLEQRNINWNYAKMRFNIVNGIKTKSELDDILRFFRNVKGRAFGFRFKDWSDYNAKKQIIGYGDGIKKEFQLIKSYIVNNNFYTRKINKPVFSTVKIYLDNVESDNFSIDFTSGLLSFDYSIPMNVKVEADFEFDVPVRFDSDVIEVSMETVNTGFVKDISLIEI